MFDSNFENYYPQEYLDSFKNAKVVLLVPITRTLPRFWESIVDMIAFSWNFGLRVETIIPCMQSIITDARRILTDAALKYKSPYDGKEYTHFLCIDDDHTFAPDLACNLVYKMLVNDAKIMSAVCYTKGNEPLPPIHVASRESGHFEYKRIIKYPKKVFKVDTVGFGVIMIKREVFETVKEPWFRITSRCSEDNYFCLKAKKFGFDIFIDGECTTGHIGENIIVDENNYEEHLKNSNYELEAIKI